MSHAKTEPALLLRAAIPIPKKKVRVWSVTLISTGAEIGLLIADNRDEALDSARLMAGSKGLTGERLKVRRTEGQRVEALRPGTTKVVTFTAASQDETESLAEPMRAV